MEEIRPEDIGAIVHAEPLKDFCRKVLVKLGVTEEDARITADVLVMADLRAIFSHGVARLRRYVDGIKSGMMKVHPEVKIVRKTQTTATIDAGGGLGQPVSYQAMKLAIQKAREFGVGFVAARNSNHYGIAGYYAMMALEYELIGISSTNADLLVVPTFGRKAILGTNPISMAVPAGRERPFVLDMATSAVPRGKLEVYDRLGKRIPLGWATDEKGHPTEDPGLVLRNLKERRGGGLLPLGGAGEEMGGHKGYGLALAVDILCGVLSGAAYADLVYPKDEQGRPLPSNIGHFFGAIRVDSFRPLEEFKAAMDDLICRLKDSPKAEGQTRIYIHGEKEFEVMEKYAKAGIPLDKKVVEDLKTIAREVGVEYDL